MSEIGGGNDDPLSRLLAQTIDVEDRLRAVKASAVKASAVTAPGSARARLPGRGRDRVLLASAGAAAVAAYLGWRAGRRRAAGRVRHRRADPVGRVLPRRFNIES
ncbi:MAG TPA: hypothetical protein VHI50_07040 [Micromonosporaceae bacterium]|nr:hypothetical protein [Micromonosporaceae bacterium]